jgi:soluble lytic murein transglycosylase-like protein
MQVMPSTAQPLQLAADEPNSNVLAGARFLRKMLDRFRSSDPALAAYNAGPTAVERSGGAPSSVTMAYVENVTSLWRELNGCK